mmetsp:Transcript_2052/g.5907  ORF Transcript_2052/g.5907 Transcript_2052/m.5907 type:complete len:342 (-) Transcript_2052:641-1666(-)
MQRTLRSLSLVSSRSIASAAAAPRRSIPRQPVAPLRIITTRTRSVSGSADGNSFDGQRTKILSAALDKVHEFGWSDDAIAAGVVALNLPPSTIGLVTGGPSELVAFFMDHCNRRLEQELKERFIPSWEEQRTPIPERIHQAIWCRLEMVSPYIRSGRWQDGMALGAMPPNNALTTAGQLSHLVDTITSAVGLPCVGVVEKATIGGVYATTELHMLADDSPAFEQTAVFLGHRVREMETMAGAASSMGSGGPGILSPEMAVAATSVATSLGGALVSLAQPAALGAASTVASQVMPQVSSFMSAQAIGGSSVSSTSPGTSAKDYSDLPPFDEPESEGSSNKNC